MGEKVGSFLVNGKPDELAEADDFGPAGFRMRPSLGHSVEDFARAVAELKELVQLSRPAAREIWLSVLAAGDARVAVVRPAPAWTETARHTHYRVRAEAFGG